MKKVLCAVLVVVMMLSLVACSNVSQSYADKVNKAAEKDEHYTVDKIRKDLGDNAVEILILDTGVIIAVDGCDSLEDIQTKLDEGKTVKGIVITMLAGKATAAKYKEISEDDFK